MNRNLSGAARTSRVRRVATRAFIALCTTVATTLVGACNNESITVPPPAVAAKLVVFAGDGQTGHVATLAFTPVSVYVTDTKGLPMAGAAVDFTATGTGSFGATEAISDSSGVATTLFTYGTAEGDYTIFATTAGVTDTAKFTVHAQPGPAQTIQELAGNAQQKTAGNPLDTPLSIELTDLFGNPIVGMTVTWSVTGGGTLSSATSVTDDNGTASVTLTLGPTPGTETVVAHVDSVPDAVFVATAK